MTSLTDELFASGKNSSGNEYEGDDGAKPLLKSCSGYKPERIFSTR